MFNPAPPHKSTRWRATIFGLAMAMLFGGCGASEHFTGRWRTSSTQEAITPLANALGMEVRLGHFGGEVAGTVWPLLYRQSSKPLPDCSCLYITSGNATSDALSFVLETDTCPELNLEGQVVMELERTGDNEVRGHLTHIDAKNQEIAKIEIRLTRPTDGNETVLLDERGCNYPAPEPQNTGADATSSTDGGAQ